MEFDYTFEIYKALMLLENHKHLLGRYNELTISTIGLDRLIDSRIRDLDSVSFKKYYTKRVEGFSTKKAYEDLTGRKYQSGIKRSTIRLTGFSKTLYAIIIRNVSRNISRKELITGLLLIGIVALITWLFGLFK